MELREEIRLTPLHVEAHVKLSKLLLKEMRLGEAVAHLWPAIQDTPREHSAPLRFQLGLALALQQQPDAAEPLLEQVLQLEPGFVEAEICLSNCQAAQGKFASAATSLRRAAALRPEIADWCESQSVQLRAQAEREGGGGDR
uniref:Uncharacterized protein n=1 Tax=Haptolina ericina TaxID=156174 RepID=A0A7S3C2G9_9EUKA